MAKTALAFTLAGLCAAALAGGSYYLGRLSTDDSSGIAAGLDELRLGHTPAAAQENDGCSSKTVQKTVIDLIAAQAPPKVAWAASQPKYEELNAVALVKDNTSEAELLQCKERQFDQERIDCRKAIEAAQYSQYIKQLDVYIDMRQKAIGRAQYLLSNVRTTSINRDVGSKLCTAIVIVKLPEDWGSGEKEFSYKVERTSDNGLYITLIDPQKI